MAKHQKINVNIILLGTFTHDIEKHIKKLSVNRSLSELFLVVEPKVITDIPDPKISPQYTTSELSDKLPEPEYTNEILLGIINKRIIDKNNANFCYPISKNVALISVYGVTELLNGDNLSIYSYLLSMIYKYVILKHCGYDFSIENIHHSMVKHCLFAKCDEKSEIIQILNKAAICHSCRSTIDKKAISVDFHDILRKELKHIKKSTFYRINDWIKVHPIISIIVFCLSTILLNILSSALYGVLNAIFK